MEDVEGNSGKMSCKNKCALMFLPLCNAVERGVHANKGCIIAIVHAVWGMKKHLQHNIKLGEIFTMEKKDNKTRSTILAIRSELLPFFLLYSL